MYGFFIAAIIIVSILIIISILLQESKTNSLAGLTNGADELFVKSKVRGVDLLMQRVTIALGLIFFILVTAVTFM